MVFDTVSFLVTGWWEARHRSQNRVENAMMTAPRESTVETPLPQPHAIRSRRALPSSRAVLGALLVTIGALGTFTLASDGLGPPETSYLVATRDLQPGETIATTDVRFEAMELSAELSATTLNSVEGLDGAVVLHDLGTGELIDVAHLLAATVPGDRRLSSVHEVTFGIPLDRSPTALVPGDRITVLATTPETTTVAVEHAVVLDIDSRPDQIRASGRGVVTIAVEEPATVMQVAHLTQTTDITVVRSTRALGDRYPNVFAGEDTDR